MLGFKVNNKLCALKKNNKYYAIEVASPLVISSDTVLSEPLIHSGPVIINQGVTVTVSAPMVSLVIDCAELTNNGTIDVTGKGFQGPTYSNVVGNGYANGGYTYGHTLVSSYCRDVQFGGGAPDADKDSARKTMLGLASATPGLFIGCDTHASGNNAGVGYAGTNGGGGGGGNDGAAHAGGGSGAGGGGGGSGHGSYWKPTGGDGSQADPVTNLALFKNNQLTEIPLFGASGASGWGVSDASDNPYDTSNGGGNIQIYADIITNNGIIRANGETIALNGNTSQGGCGGGGGGCIMMRYTTYTNTGTVEANGSAGSRYRSYYYGGNGGNGLILLDEVNS